MDHSRHSSKRHSTSSSKPTKKTSKKKRSRDENGSGNDNKIVSVSSSVIKPLVEYSDVSSEDLSEPEAGEIQSEGSYSENDLSHHHRHPIHPKLDEDYSRHITRKALTGHRIVDAALLSRSPSPLNDRKHSGASSDVSRTSSMRHRKRHDSSPTGAPYGMRTTHHIAGSPSPHLITAIDDYDVRRHRKKKDKKHKRDKKSSKKKKKKSKHRSRSSSIESNNQSQSNNNAEQRLPEATTDGYKEPLSDWEPAVTPVYRPPSIDRVDEVTCSPVSPPSLHSASPTPDGPEQINSPAAFSPRGTGTPPQPPPVQHSRAKYLSCVESPHTPQLPPKAYEATKQCVPVDDDDYNSSYSGRKQLSSSPILSDTIRHCFSPVVGRMESDHHHVHNNWAHQQSLSPVKSSPFRNPSPDVQIVHVADGLSPSRKRRRVEKEVHSHSHRRHRKEKERLKDSRRRLSRSRSPLPRSRHRGSRSPSWSRSKRYSRSSSRSRMSKRYRSRTPKRVVSPRGSPVR